MGPTTKKETSEEPTPEPELPSREDLIKKYRDDGEFRFGLLKILSDGFNSLIALQDKQNELLNEQNILIKTEETKE